MFFPRFDEIDHACSPGNQNFATQGVSIPIRVTQARLKQMMLITRIRRDTLKVS